LQINFLIFIPKFMIFLSINWDLVDLCFSFKNSNV
jgi:hypothetical protein